MPHAEPVHRLLSVSESVLAALEQQVVVAVTIDGPLETTVLRTAVDRLCRAQPVLSATVVAEGGLRFRLEAPAPQDVRVVTGGDFDGAIRGFAPGEPLLRVTVLPRMDGAHTVVVAVHHAVSDGVSVLELTRALWGTYTALVTGREPEATEAQDGLPTPVEQWLVDRHDRAEIDAFLARRAVFTASVVPAVLPVGEGAGTGSHLSRVAITPSGTLRLRELAQRCGGSLHALLSASLLVAVRGQIAPERGALPLTCMSAVDLRRRVTPGVPPGRLVHAASIAYTALDVAPDDDPLKVAPEFRSRLRRSVDAGDLELELVAAEQAAAHFTTAPISLAVTNVAHRPLSLELPPGVRAGCLRFFSQPPGPFPIAFVSASWEGLGIDLGLGRSWFSAGQCTRLAEAVRDVVAGLLGDAEAVEVVAAEPIEEAQRAPERRDAPGTPAVHA
ncbi:phthiocerol/phthiodiolone dimycocerosyl transferase family protein [Streptomyces clavuligerus]|nr:condensation domain-containing protein [Streptomyces clavuligerus]WDN56623.1 condensation domain-containing protein [Streptomyces clavuligerus]